MLFSACILVVSCMIAAAPAPSTGAKPPATAPASDLDYWLSRARPVEPNKPAATTRPRDANDVAKAFKSAKTPFRRGDALPGVIELSDGRQIPGGLYTTIEKPWIVWSEATKSWRRVDFLALLSIEAVVEEERLELTWRWKGMGEPERVYTGKRYPMRRVHWKFKLIDGSVIEGSTKGQPVFAELAGKVAGPFILSERMKGKDGQALDELIYVRKIVISRKMMDLVIADKANAK